MKYLSKLGMVLLLVILVLTMSSCEKKDEAVVGKWSVALFTARGAKYAPQAYSSTDGYIDFDKGAKGILYLDGNEYPFDWEYQDGTYILKLRYESKEHELVAVLYGEELRVFDLPMFGHAMATFVKDASKFVLPADARTELDAAHMEALARDLDSRIIDLLTVSTFDIVDKEFTTLYTFDTGILTKEREARFGMKFRADGTGEFLNPNQNSDIEWKINSSAKLEVTIVSDGTVLHGGMLGNTLVLYEREDRTFAMLLTDNVDQYALPYHFQEMLERSQQAELDRFLFYDGWIRIVDQSSAYSTYQDVFVDCWAGLEDKGDGKFLFSVYEGPFSDKEYEPIMSDTILNLNVKVDYQRGQLVMVPADPEKGSKNYLFTMDLDQAGEPFVIDLDEGKIHIRRLFVDEDKDYVEVEIFLREEGTNWQPGDVLPPSLEK